MGRARPDVAGPAQVTPYYDVDGTTIYHADCADVFPLVPPEAVDLLLTDPPYGIDLDTDYSALHGSHRVYARVEGDAAPFNPKALLTYGRCVLWGGNHYASRLPDSPSWLVWDKRGHQQSTVFSDVEMAWTNLGGPAVKYRHLWGVNRETERGLYVHPTQKPVALMRWIVDRWTEPGDLVFDPYMGSGPVARACADLGRRYIGVEIVEEYCQAAVNRLGQMALPL